MNKIFIGVFVLFALLASFAYATSHTSVLGWSGKDTDRFPRSTGNGGNHVYNPDNELSQSACGSHLGKPVISVEQKVQNDADSGQAGNYWAFDYYTRHITVWAVSSPSASPTTYCAIVTYSGNFYAVPGQVGPGNTPTGAKIGSDGDHPISGFMSGGRRATIVGTILALPLWKTNGSVGTTDYACDITGTCTGVISWPGQYFESGYTYNDDWWGWKYTAGHHGTWINAVTGNSGNIL